MASLTCKPDLMSKTYPEGQGERSWFGRKSTKISCAYRCKAPDGTVETVRGTHTVSYFVDTNSTLSCKGAYYPPDQWDVVNSEWRPRPPLPREFDPATSGVPALVEWARKHKR